MFRLKDAKFLLLAGGIFELLIAITHFVMPYELKKDKVFALLPAAHYDFIILATVAIGLIMLVLCALAFYFVKNYSNTKQAAGVFALSQGFLWLGRGVLEVMFPVKVQLLFLTNPALIILPMSLVISAIFFGSYHYSRKGMD